MSLDSTTRRDLAITAGGIGGQSTAYSDYTTSVKLWRALYGDLADGWLVIWTKTHGIHPYHVGDLVTAARKVAELAPVADVYFSVCLQRQRPAAGARGEAAGVVAVPALWDDLDALTPGHHKGDNLPSMMQLEDFVADLPLAPSAVIHSGGGLQAYWFLTQPAIIGDEDERARIAALSRGWQGAIQRRAQAHGWKFDNTSDLARVLRVPGTFNRKTADVKPVKLLYLDPTRRYSLGELQAHIKAEPVDAGDLVDQVHPVTSVNGNGKTLKLVTYNSDAGDFWLERARAWARDGSRDGRNAAGFDLACQLRDDELTTAEAERVMLAYQQAVRDTGDHEYTQAEALASLKSAYSRPARDRAQAQGVKPSTQSTNGSAPAGDPVADVSLIWECYERDEDGDADLLAHLYGEGLTYDHIEGAWYIFNGHTWARDNYDDVTGFITGKVASQYLALAAKYTDESATLDGDLKKQKLGHADALARRAKQLRNITRVKHILELARRQLAFRGEWDGDPDLLGVANGVVDLRTGKHRPGQPGDNIRTVAPTEWQSLDATAPRWLQFIREVMAEDEREETPMSDFLQRLLGYAITGYTNERKLAFFYGAGANGKDTLLEALAGALGSLAGVVKSDILLERRPQGHDTPLMDLRGRRLVWVNETAEGDRLNTAQVKAITGGGRIVARGAYDRRTSTWSPTHFVVLMTNNLPVAPATDQAFWDRVIPVPFNRRFLDRRDMTGKDNERPADPTLRAQLEAERPGILAWLVRGALAWRREGLQPPALVAQAKATYRSDVDDFGRFLAETYTTNVNERLTADDLRDDWLKWSGKDTSKVTLGRWMTKRGYDRVNSGGIAYLGLSRKAEDANKG